MPTNPGPGSTRASVQSRWWVVGGVIPPVVSNSTEPAHTVAGPFISKKAAYDWVDAHNQAGNPFRFAKRAEFWNWPSEWLKSMGADIGSGIESGFVTVLQDIWNVIVGPIEVLGGLAIVLVTFIAYFKDDIVAAASMAMAFA